MSTVQTMTFTVHEANRVYADTTPRCDQADERRLWEAPPT